MFQYHRVKNIQGFSSQASNQTKLKLTHKCHTHIHENDEACTRYLSKLLHQTFRYMINYWFIFILFFKKSTSGTSGSTIWSILLSLLVPLAYILWEIHHSTCLVGMSKYCGNLNTVLCSIFSGIENHFSPPTFYQVHIHSHSNQDSQMQFDRLWTTPKNLFSILYHFPLELFNTNILSWLSVFKWTNYMHIIVSSQCFLDNLNFGLFFFPDNVANSNT